MTNYGQNNDNQDSLSPGGESDDFVMVEEKKPMNTSVVALILIAAVGGALVYFMYLRGRFNADTQTPQQKQMTEAVSDFMANSDSSINQMDQELAKTEKAVAAFQQSNDAGQVPLNQLRLNPFEIEQPRSAAGTVAPLPRNTAPDPADVVRNAAGKVKVQMILYSTAGSSANIGNRLVKTGDRVEIDQVQFTVKTITQTSVVLSHPTGDFTVLVAQGM